MTDLWYLFMNSAEVTLFFTQISVIKDQVILGEVLCYNGLDKTTIMMSHSLTLQKMVNIFQTLIFKCISTNEKFGIVTWISVCC